MSTKEVTQLRRNGQLDEALKMANTILENDKSAWSYRALYWVLYDMCKQGLSNGQKDEVITLIEQMKDILPNMEEEENSLASQRLNALEQELMPHTAIIRQADQDSNDEHTVARAFDSIKSVINDDSIEMDNSQQTTAGWIIYRYVKHVLDRKESRNVKIALALYLKLNVEKPSHLHSSILRKAVELEGEFRNDFKFTTFLQMWGFGNFTEEDWNQFRTEEGRNLPSLAEKAIGRYCKELVDDEIHTVPDEFVRLIEEARKRFPNNENLELNYARLLAARGDTDDAVTAYRRVTERFPQPYVWQEMANLITDMEIKKAILCKVITMQRDEQFLGEVRLKLAGLLIKDRNFSAAKHELETYHNARQERGWAIRNPYYELLGKIPTDTQAPANNNDLYHGMLSILNTFLYPDAATAVMFYNGSTFTDRRGRRKAKLFASNGNSIHINSSRLPRHSRRQEYYFYTVKYASTERGVEPLEITPLDTQEGLQHFEVINGEVRINRNREGRTFGFVGDCYVHQSLLSNVNNGQHLRILAARRTDGRLSAIAILPCQ